MDSTSVSARVAVTGAAADVGVVVVGVQTLDSVEDGLRVRSIKVLCAGDRALSTSTTGETGEDGGEVVDVSTLTVVVVVVVFVSTNCSCCCCSCCCASFSLPPCLLLLSTLSFCSLCSLSSFFSSSTHLDERSNVIIDIED